jgi:GTP-binding protein
MKVVDASFAAGRSNVGKSSLLNAMMQRKSLARTSNTPGCTRQINVFHVKTQEGIDVHFVDLPGYGYAKRSKSEKAGWGPMLEGYLLERITLRAVVLLVDVRRGPEEDDIQLIEFLKQRKEVQVFVVATKLDKLPLAQRKPALDKIKKDSGIKPLGFSSVTGDGREDLWKRIAFAVLPEAAK